MANTGLALLIVEPLLIFSIILGDIAKEKELKLR